MQSSCGHSVVIPRRFQHSDLGRALPPPLWVAPASGTELYTSANSLLVDMLLSKRDPEVPLRPLTVMQQGLVSAQRSTWSPNGSFPVLGIRDVDVLQLDSVRRKRASKMNKHKHRKRRRRDRAARK